jgi:hypothetical protein
MGIGGLWRLLLEDFAFKMGLMGGSDLNYKPGTHLENVKI